MTKPAATKDLTTEEWNELTKGLNPSARQFLAQAFIHNATVKRYPNNIQINNFRGQSYTMSLTGTITHNKD